MPARARRAGAFFLIYIYMYMLWCGRSRTYTNTHHSDPYVCAYARVCVCPLVPHHPIKCVAMCLAGRAAHVRAAQIVLPAAKCTLTRTPKHKPKSPKLPPPGLPLCVCIYVVFFVMYALCTSWGSRRTYCTRAFVSMLYWSGFNTGGQVRTHFWATCGRDNRLRLDTSCWILVTVRIHLVKRQSSDLPFYILVRHSRYRADDKPLSDWWMVLRSIWFVWKWAVSLQFTQTKALYHQDHHDDNVQIMVLIKTPFGVFFSGHNSCVGCVASAFE